MSVTVPALEQDAQTRAVLNSLGIEQSKSAGNGVWLNVFMWVRRTVARLIR